MHVVCVFLSIRGSACRHICNSLFTCLFWFNVSAYLHVGLAVNICPSGLSARQCLSICLSVFCICQSPVCLLSLSAYVPVSVCLSVWQCPPIKHSVFAYLSVSVCLSANLLSLSAYQPIIICLSASRCMPISCQYLPLFLTIPAYLPVNLCLSASQCLPAGPTLPIIWGFVVLKCPIIVCS